MSDTVLVPRQRAERTAGAVGADPDPDPDPDPEHAARGGRDGDGSRLRRGMRGTALGAELVFQDGEGCDFDLLRAAPAEPTEPLGLLSGWVGGW